MSGFIAGFGKTKLGNIHRSFEKIIHRGPDLSGIINNKKAILAQNYLQADTLDENENAVVPISSEDSNNIMICYDGQIPNSMIMHSYFPKTVYFCFPKTVHLYFPISVQCYFLVT